MHLVDGHPLLLPPLPPMAQPSLRQTASPHASHPTCSNTCLFLGAETSLKRFWKTVDIEQHEAGFTVTLDKRPLKTPSGNKLHIPHDKKLVATLIAGEWENQQTLLKPHALPIVRSISKVIAGVPDKAFRLRWLQGLSML